MRIRPYAYGCLLAAVSVWITLIVLAPYARRQEWLIAPFLYFFFSSLCHQLAERSFWWMGSPLAVCHRCLGLYVGFWMGLIVFPFWKRGRRSLIENPRRLLLFALPMSIDLALENTPASRFVSGMVAAFPTALFLRLAIEQLLVKEKPL